MVKREAKFEMAIVRCASGDLSPLVFYFVQEWRCLVNDGEIIDEYDYGSCTGGEKASLMFSSSTVALESSLFHFTWRRSFNVNSDVL